MRYLLLIVVVVVGLSPFVASEDEAALVEGSSTCTGKENLSDSQPQNRIDTFIQRCQNRGICMSRIERLIKSQINNKDSILRKLFGRLLDNPSSSDSTDGKAEPTDAVSGRMIRLIVKIFGESKTVVGFLWRYGYIPKVINKSPKAAESSIYNIPPCAVTDAIMEFQKFNKLPATGILTKETRELMAKDRCGNADVECETPECQAEMTENHDEYLRRKKRFVFSKKAWEINDDGKVELNYFFTNYPDTRVMQNRKFQILSKEEIRAEIEKGFRTWTDVAPIILRETNVEAAAHITIGFGEGDHGDNSPFTGRGGSLAHMFYPTNGRMHFDTAENFTKETEDFNSVSLFFAAAHEMGHGLGLKHSQTYGAIMYAYYTGYRSPMLRDDDIMGITGRYGKGVGKTIPYKEEEEEEEEKESSCLSQYSGGLGNPDGNRMYFFSGNKLVQVEPENPSDSKLKRVPKFSKGNPRPISEVFEGLEGPFDYAFTIKPKKKSYFFKNNRVYVWDWARAGLENKDGVLRSESDFRILPAKTTATTVLQKGSRSYVIAFYDSKYTIMDVSGNKLLNPTGSPSPLGSTMIRAVAMSFYNNYSYLITKDHTYTMVALNKLLKAKSKKIPATQEEAAASIMAAYKEKDALRAWLSDANEAKNYVMCA